MKFLGTLDELQSLVRKKTKRSSVKDRPLSKRNSRAESLKDLRLGKRNENPEVAETELRGVTEWEETETQRILQTKTLAETTRNALIKARVGQGLFRKRVTQFEDHCRVTDVRYAPHLFASYINPWRESTMKNV